jgi:hypothetical protein
VNDDDYARLFAHLFVVLFGLLLLGVMLLEQLSAEGNAAAPSLSPGPPSAIHPSPDYSLALHANQILALMLASVPAMV